MCNHCGKSVTDMFQKWAQYRYRRRFLDGFAAFLIEWHDWLPLRGSGR